MFLAFGAHRGIQELKNLFVANGRGVLLATVDRQIEKLFQQIKAVSKVRCCLRRPRLLHATDAT